MKKTTRELEIETANALGYEAGWAFRDGRMDEYHACHDKAKVMVDAHYAHYGLECSAELVRAWDAGFKLALNRERRRS